MFDVRGLLRTARHEAGLTQRGLAARAATSAAAIAGYETGGREPGVATFVRLIEATGLRLEAWLASDASDARDLAAVAAEARAAVTDATRGDAEAFRAVVAFLAWARTAAPTAVAAAVAVEPQTVQDERWDAFIGAACEQACLDQGVPVPAWAVAPSRFLDTWWFVNPYRSLHAHALVSAPAPFANRGVFVDAASLESV